MQQWDELPWLASARSGFLSALDHFWNSFGSRNNNLILVICGSAASWMIVNVLHHKGGLRNRVTRSLALKPFNLQVTQTFLLGRGVQLDPEQILELFMAVGGIPYYLDYVRKGRSAAQTIDALFFNANAALSDEFTQLYERHLKVIRALARKHSGLTWAGYAFENVCLSHVRQIRKALGISGILTEEISWQHRPQSKADPGAQGIDLLIDRPDRVVNLCEMKHSSIPFAIDKKYAQWLRERAEVFRRVTGTSKTLFNTFVTTHGLARNFYAQELVGTQVTADMLFDP